MARRGSRHIGRPRRPGKSKRRKDWTDGRRVADGAESYRFASFLPLGRTLTAPASESNCCQHALMIELMNAASFGYDSGQTFTVCFWVLGGKAERSVSAVEAYHFLEDSDAVAASVLGLSTKG